MRVLKGNPVVKVATAAGKIELSLTGELKDDKGVVLIKSAATITQEKSLCIRLMPLF